jgi:serine/threonine protein kinase
MIKIGDFGLVVSTEQQIYGLNNLNGKKKKNSNDGTFLYMSPEQVCYKTGSCISHY